MRKIITLIILVAICLATFSLAYDITDCTTDSGGLYYASINCSADWFLKNDINCTGIKSPLCSVNPYYTGTFDGENHTIDGLIVNGTLKTGMISIIASSGVVKNLGLTNVNITGTGTDHGGLAAENFGIINNTYVTGHVIGDSQVGVLVGNVEYGTVDNSYSTGTVTATIQSAGGLVGYLYIGSIDNSYSTSNVTAGNDYVGGLVGLTLGGTIDNSFATGIATGSSYIGGLVGKTSGTVTNSYWHNNSGDDVDHCIGNNAGHACESNEELITYFQGTVSGIEPFLGDWDFTNVWEENVEDYPTLLAFAAAASGGEATAPNITDNSGNSFNLTDSQDSEISGTIEEDTNITIKDSTGTKLVEVEGQFSNGAVDLSNLVIEYDSQRIVVDFSSVSTNIASTHTLYYPNDGVGFTLCPEAKTLGDAVPGCLNETLFTHYDATNNLSKSVAGVYDVTATIDGNYYKISGLTGTAITWAKNVSIITKVSISNTPPIVDSVTLSDSDGGDMDLYPNASVTINCSGTASDTDGWSTITVNATINSTVAAGSTNSLLNHYSNTSCVTTQNTATVANYFCTFDVWYNAIPGTWTCTVIADDASTTASNSDTETMGQLMAIDLNQGDLDFGSMAIGESTTDSALDNSMNKTIYNQGNVIFDVNLKAYGDSGIGDNHSMSCDAGNITISMLRYTFNTTAEAHNWTLMTPIVNGSGTDYNISIPVSPDTSGTPANPSNDTWWAYKIPTSPIVSGDCSGTLIFSAISDT